MRGLKNTIVTVAGLLVGVSAFAGCYFGSCEQETIPEWSLASGTFESENVYSEEDDTPHARGAELKTMVVDLDADRVVIRYLDAEERRVEETWRLGPREQFDTWY